MPKIVFDGWEEGVEKISFTKLLHEKAGVSLKEAKNIKDRVVDDDEVVIIIVDNVNLANEIVEEAVKMKVKARLI